MVWKLLFFNVPGKKTMKGVCLKYRGRRMSWKKKGGK